MAYIITFICGTIVGLLASVCAAMAGEDDRRNGRDGDV